MLEEYDDATSESVNARPTGCEFPQLEALDTPLLGEKGLWASVLRYGLWDALNDDLIALLWLFDDDESTAGSFLFILDVLNLRPYLQCLRASVMRCNRARFTHLMPK